MNVKIILLFIDIMFATQLLAQAKGCTQQTMNDISQECSQQTISDNSSQGRSCKIIIYKEKYNNTLLNHEDDYMKHMT